MKLIDPTVTFHDGYNGQLGIVTTQEITPDFFKDLDFIRETNEKAYRTNEIVPRAVIPAVLVDLWKREGYDVYKEPHSKTLAKLRLANCQKFIVKDV